MCVAAVRSAEHLRGAGGHRGVVGKGRDPVVRQGRRNANQLPALPARPAGQGTPQ